MAPIDPLSDYRSACHSYGFLTGTDAFSQCMLDQEKVERKDLHYRKKMSGKNTILNQNTAISSASVSSGVQIVHNIYVSPRDVPLDQASSYSAYRAKTRRGLSNKASDAFAANASATHFSSHQVKPRSSGRNPFKEEIQAKVAEREVRMRRNAAREEQIRSDEAYARALQSQKNSKTVGSKDSIPPAPPPPPVMKSSRMSNGSTKKSFKEELAEKVAEREKRISQ